MTQRACLLVLIGLPGAGKSTFCRNLLQIPQSHFKIVHICYDDFLQFPQNSAETPLGTESHYKAQRSAIFDMISELLKNLTEIPKHLLEKVNISNNIAFNDYLILCDDNHFYRSMRYKLYQLCKTYNCAYMQMYIECAEELSLQRNATRSIDDRIPENIIQQMAARIEKPNPQNSWESITLNMSSEVHSSHIFEKLVELIFKGFQEVDERKLKVNKNENILDTNEQTILHKLDLLLRRRIGDLLNAENDQNTKKIYALQLNARRKEILQQLRQRGNVTESELNQYVNLLSKN